MSVAAFHLPPLYTKVAGLRSKDVGFRSKVLFLNRFLVDYDGIFLKTFKEKKPKEKTAHAAFPFATTSVVRAIISCISSMPNIETAMASQ